jgi:ubiquinone/menaquinone biosynthesis C-methylase UbiE
MGRSAPDGTSTLDFGCGPGFFTLDLAQMVGSAGRVVAADLQAGMLDRLRGKIQGTALAERITLHACEPHRIGWSGKVDFALAFYVVHEIPDQQRFFAELGSLVQPGGQVLVVEPPIHVSKSAFAETLRKAQAAGFTAGAGPKVRFSKTAILSRG